MKSKTKPNNQNPYDFIIIGAGGTGLAAAMYAARLNLKTLILGWTYGTEAAIGGVITTTNIVENYPGFISLSGYELAKKLGHTIVKPLPALSSIRVKEKWVKSLQGVSLKGVKITVFQKGKKRFQEEGSILFTHFGISGPAVLNISANVGDLLEKGLSVGQAGEAKICFDLAPLLNQGEFGEKINEILKKYPKKKFKNILSDFAPEKLTETLLDIVGVDKNKTANNLSKIEREITIKVFKNLEVTAESIFGFNEAKTTRGGISLAEIDGKTMRSKIIDNLFFAGEVIDVDGKTGGFNLQMCWSTGYIAGESCGQG